MLSNPDYAGKVAIALPPSNDGKTQMTFSGCRLMFIGKDCKNPDAAFDFISYALSQSVVLKRAQDIKVPVVLDSLVDQYSGLDEFNSIRAQCVANGTGMPITTWSTSFQTVRNELVQSVENGADPAAALAEAQAKLEQEIANAG
jgi:maltose-binding protein MalE